MAKSLEMREALRGIPADKRREWAESYGKPCSACQEASRACSFPSHWSGETLDAAYAALASGAPAPAEVSAPEATLAEVEPKSATRKPASAKPEGAADKFGAFVRAILEEVGVANKDEMVETLTPAIEKIVAKAVKGIPPREHVIRVGDRPVVKLDGLLHEAFDAVLKRAEARIPVLLVGPAGSGKTYLAAQVAKALTSETYPTGFPFYFTSATAGMSEGVLGGRLLPIGENGRFNYVTSEFVKAYEEGGVFLLDEMDAADSNVMLKINAALANGHMTVDNRPEKPVADRHADFIFIGAANTFGNGADRQYVGRNQLDAATLNRFQMGTVEVDYDKRLEESHPGIPAHVREWGWRVRAILQEHGVRRICSTRDLINAGSLEATGVSEKGWRTSFFSGWKKDEVAKLDKDLLP